MEINKTGVIGAGMMGAEIAVCFALAGTDVVLKDATLEFAQAGKDRLGTVLDKAIKKGVLPVEEKDTVLGRITPTDLYDRLSDV
ncbi:MAG: 3-hydroxyacyl-CoA dehydrogenase family protein, partial [bacterium]|nr:3-hydroxyacyl-CoA dehydrogenase family protein [bacterium]